jgi:NADPH:quinone reductase-like Zn-dependent oxidoreductase
MQSGVVPGSDGAGTVVAVGKRVTRFTQGDSVCTTLNQGHLSGSVTPAILQTSLGGSLDGTLRQYGVFEEAGLVRMPATLDFREASALPCAAVTAWNALYGLRGRALKAGDVVLTLGTGGVSLFAVQFAVAAGATVIATTSSKEKGERLKRLGARHVIDYKATQDWGKAARRLTPGSEGVDFVVEVGGAATLQQSLAAVKIDGIMAVVGAVGGADGAQQAEPGILNAWYNTIIVRGISVGSRVQFEEMNRAIVASGLKPVVDERRFGLEELKEAYQYLWEQRHVGKVVVDCQ